MSPLISQSHFMELISITLIQNQTKISQEKDRAHDVSPMNTDAKMINTMNPENSNECKDGLPAEKSMNKIYHIHGRKKKNHMIT